MCLEKKRVRGRSRRKLTSNGLFVNREQNTADESDIRLLRYMRKLDYDITISFQPKPRDEATIRVKGAPLPA